MTTSNANLRRRRERYLALLREKQRRQIEAEKAERKAAAESSLAEFVRQAWPVVEPATPLAWEPHLDAICLHLEAVSRGDIRDLIISVPPGCTKSLTVCVFWPAWTWATRPHVRWLFAANEESLVIRDAVACRRLIMSDWYQEMWGDAFRLTSDQNVKSWYENDRRGWRTSTTVGSKTTGKKGDILVIDDPHDARKVESEADRRAVHEWYDQAFHNRVNDFRTGSRVLIGQRTHEDDLSGHLLARGGIEELRLPEEYDPSESCETSIGWRDWRAEEGELLRPERFGVEQVEEARVRLGEGYHAQHGQRPRSKEGRRFRREWLRTYSVEHERFGQGGEYVLGDKHYLCSQCWRFQTCDPAATAENVSKKDHDPDYTVVSTWAVTPDYHLVWLDCHRFRLDIPEIVPQLEVTYAQWKPLFIGIEAVGANKAVLQYASRTPMNVRQLSPMSKDKLIRATPAMTLARSGRLWLPERAHWLAAAVDELLAFTGDPRKDRHDDVCFAPGTMILTRRGEVPIERVRRSDEVMTRKGWRRVVAGGQTSACADRLTVILSGGTSLTCTPSHPVWVCGKGFVAVDSLSYGDMVCAWENQSHESRRCCSTGSCIADIQTPPAETIGFISKLTRSGNSRRCCCTARFGKPLMDPYPVGWRSITLTGTPSTTTSPTWHASPRRSTAGSTPNGEPFARKPSRPTSTGSARWLPNGTALARGVSGTPKTQNKHLQNVSQCFVCACGAAINGCLCRWTPAISFAPGSVRRLTGEHQGWTTNLERVLCAPGLSRSTNTPRQSVAPASVVGLLPHASGPVYNLTVEGEPEFFANGVLVHNCDTVSYASQMLDEHTYTGGGKPAVYSRRGG